MLTSSIMPSKTPSYGSDWGLLEFGWESLGKGIVLNPGYPGIEDGTLKCDTTLLQRWVVMFIGIRHIWVAVILSIIQDHLLFLAIIHMRSEWLHFTVISLWRTAVWWDVGSISRVFQPGSTGHFKCFFHVMLDLSKPWPRGPKISLLTVLKTALWTFAIKHHYNGMAVVEDWLCKELILPGSNFEVYLVLKGTSLWFFLLSWIQLTASLYLNFSAVLLTTPTKKGSEFEIP